MSFMDLQRGILELFAEAQGYGDGVVKVGSPVIIRSNAASRAAQRRARLRAILGPGFRRSEYSEASAAKHARRTAWWRGRQPCRVCGTVITLVAVRGPVPSYCGTKCSDIGRHQKHDDARKAKGLCIDCGLGKAVDGRVRCCSCLESKRVYYAARRSNSVG